ncbi:hypothetical protein EB093_09000 [bacterium]|nr:hypothetical protein [bacterium]
MDDFTVANLHSSRDEWCARLVNILTPLVIEGLKSIFNEAWKMSIDNDEAAKYLMTFQNLLCRVPKWNSEIIEEERKRIVERSACGYLEDLITCVHVIQLKTLTCIRVGNRQKKIDISIPKLDAFLHKTYIHAARKAYMNVYLFEKNVSALTVQKHNRELEVLVQECILAAVRESIPTEAIIRAYLDESVEQEEEVVIEPIPAKDGEDAPETASGEKTAESGEEDSAPVIPAEIPPPATIPAIQNIDDKPVMTRLAFNDVDEAFGEDNSKEEVVAPKTIERLEEISAARNMQRKLEEEGEDDDELPLERIQINDDSLDLGELGITDLNPVRAESPLTLDFEEIMA